MTSVEFTPWEKMLKLAYEKVNMRRAAKMQTQNRSLQSMLGSKKDIQKIAKKPKVKKKEFTIKAAPTPAPAAKSAFDSLLKSKAKSGAASTAGLSMLKRKREEMHEQDKRARSQTSRDDAKQNHQVESMESKYDKAGRVHEKWSAESQEMLNVDLQDFSYTGKNSIVLRGRMPPGVQRFALNICKKGAQDTFFEDILCHFNPRRHKGGQIVLNNKQSDRWGKVQQCRAGARDFLGGQPFLFSLVMVQSGFLFLVNGSFIGEFPHRAPLLDKQPLMVNFSVADDYGNPDGLEMDWLWWGHTQVDMSAIKAQAAANEGRYGRRNQENEFSKTDCYVGGIPACSRADQHKAENDLRELFSHFGVKTVRVIADRGFGFVGFITAQGATEAIRDMDGQEIRGMKLRVSRARMST